MRKFLCMVLTGAMIIGCLCTSAGATDELGAKTGELEATETITARATGTLDCTVKANSNVSVKPAFSMAAGETVRIRANYSPENVSVDLGLVDSDGVYHYVNVTTGSIDKTIEVPENGSYTLMIRNKSSKSVVVTGIVGY